MSIKNLLTFHIAVPVFFGLSAVGAASSGVYAPAFLCALFAFVFTSWGWQKACQWLQLPPSFARYRWWCAGGAFLVWATVLSSNPEFQAQEAKKKADEVARKAVREKERAEKAVLDSWERDAKDKQNAEKMLFAADGRCGPLVAEVKRRLHDPSSFEHVYTDRTKEGDHFKVKMTYRAKNAFGALRLSNVSAIVNRNGTVGELKEQ